MNDMGFAARQSDEDAGDRDEPLVSGVDSESELLQRDGAQERTTARWAGEEHGRTLEIAEPHAGFSEAPHITLTIGELDRPLLRRRECQLSDDLSWKRGIDRPRVDQEID